MNISQATWIAPTAEAAFATDQDYALTPDGTLFVHMYRVPLAEVAELIAMHVADSVAA